MGRTKATLVVRNASDVEKAADRLLPQSDVRAVEIEAIVDTGATYVCLPRAEIERLGLRFVQNAPVRTANGRAVRRIFGRAEVGLLGRTTHLDIMENDEDTPPLIGCVLLELLDLVVDPKAGQITPNAEHEGKWVVDCFLTAR
ncbi:MAG TPA: retroviral-like aspartic protease family protein [Planctomycetota bacterium]|nr:retroviral-like aspartic protease family protein [Planctomycetota bacterium]